MVENKVSPETNNQPTGKPAKQEKKPEKSRFETARESFESKKKSYTAKKKELEEKKQDLWDTAKTMRTEYSGNEEFEDWEKRELWDTQSQFEKSRKDTVGALSERHSAWIEKNIQSKKLGEIDSGARNLVYKNIAAQAVEKNYDKIPELSKKTQDTRTELEKDEAFKKLPLDEQNKRIREKIISAQVSGVSDVMEQYKKLPPEEQKKPEEIKKITDFIEKNMWITDNKAVLDELLDDEKVKKWVIDSIVKNWMLESGITFDTPLGKELVAQCLSDYHDLVGTMWEDLRIDDLPISIRQNLFHNENFLDQNEELPTTLNNDIERVRKEFRVREWETDDNRNKRLDSALQKTGISRDKIEKMMGWVNRDKLHPFIRFLADLLAPIGAMMGGKMGEFWKNYLKQNGQSADWKGPLSGLSGDPEWRTLNAQHSADHKKNVSNFIKDGPDPAYEGKINSTASNIERYQSRYQAVSDALKSRGKNIPWQVIGAIHEREGSLDFGTCLHNGDPLGQVTTHVPAWLWPFDTWEAAAIDALSRETYIPGMDITTVDWLAAIAEYCERYNGLWYRKRWRVSPYVWSGARFYTGWRYVADGKFSATSKDSRPGTMPVIMALAKKMPWFTQFQESKEGASTNSAVRWFQEHGGAKYGEWWYDCMTSTHAALWLDANRDMNADKFQQSKILREGKETDLWNVSTAAARYTGLLAEVSSPKTWIKLQEWWYGGKEAADNTSIMEYYIEENVMKRVNDDSDGIINVSNQWKLIHYSKKKQWAQGISYDIMKRLQPGESAMMGATGWGTNIGWHEWLVAREGDKLLVYDATNYNNQWVSGTGTPLIDYLNHSRRSQYGEEAIIFAKGPQKRVDNQGENWGEKSAWRMKEKMAPDDLNELWGIFVGDSNTVALSGSEDDEKAKEDKANYEKYYKIGASSSEILQYVINAIEKKPPFISILAWTNDVNNGQNPLDNIKQMIALCRGHNIPIFLGTLPPIPGKEDQVSKTNDQIRSLAWNGVEIIDYASLWPIVTKWLHPTSEWYNKMRRLAFSQIQRKTSEIYQISPSLSIEKLRSKLPSHLKEFSQYYIDAGRKYGINPIFLAAISMHEVGKSSMSDAGSGNNLMGISDGQGALHFSTDDSGMNTRLEKYFAKMSSQCDGWPSDNFTNYGKGQSIYMQAHKMKFLRDDSGKKYVYSDSRNIADVARVYAPESIDSSGNPVTNNGHGKNKYWFWNVSSYFSELSV